MAPIESKSYQLRVRITADERDHLEKLRAQRGRGETVSDLVREAIASLGGGASAPAGLLSPKAQSQVDRLSILLRREPRQVEEACVEGILDLIESKCDVPLIVMETRLHLKYRNHSDTQEFPWNAGGPKDGAPVAETATADRKPSA